MRYTVAAFAVLSGFAFAAPATDGQSELSRLAAPRPKAAAPRPHKVTVPKAKKPFAIRDVEALEAEDVADFEDDLPLVNIDAQTPAPRRQRKKGKKLNHVVVARSVETAEAEDVEEVDAVEDDLPLVNIDAKGPGRAGGRARRPKKAGKAPRVDVRSVDGAEAEDIEEVDAAEEDLPLVNIDAKSPKRAGGRARRPKKVAKAPGVVVRSVDGAEAEDIEEVEAVEDADLPLVNIDAKAPKRAGGRARRPKKAARTGREVVTRDVEVGEDTEEFEEDLPLVNIDAKSPKRAGGRARRPKKAGKAGRVEVPV